MVFCFVAHVDPWAAKHIGVWLVPTRSEECERQSGAAVTGKRPTAKYVFAVPLAAVPQGYAY
jgi:hypothetical protein